MKWLVVWLEILFKKKAHVLKIYQTIKIPHIEYRTGQGFMKIWKVELTAGGEA